MEVNNRVKKVLAMLALVDDTQEQINRLKAEVDERIKIIKSEYSERINTLKNTLIEQQNMLTPFLGRELDRPRVSTRSGGFSPPNSDIQILKARAARYIGEQVLNPTPDDAPETEVNNGQVLSESDRLIRFIDDIPL